MGKYYIRFGLLLTLIFLCNCGDISNDNPNFVYPMNVGNQWNYLRILTITNFVPDTLAIKYERLETTDVISRVLGIKILRDSVETFVLGTSEQTDLDQFFSTTYYMPREDGLYIIAHQNAGLLYLKPIIFQACMKCHISYGKHYL